MKTVRTVPASALPFPEPKTGTELILNIGAASLHSRAKPNLSGCEVMVDGEGVSLESNKPFGFTCCDCGLTHRCVIVSEDGKPVGFAIERDQKATAEKRNGDVSPWQPIETAPEDEHVLIALTKGHYAIGWWVNDGGGVKWYYAGSVHHSIEPVAWMPPPKHPEEA